MIEEKKKLWKRVNFKTVVMIHIVMILLWSVLSFIRPLCDWYADSILYRVLSDTLMRVTSLVSFSMGEVLIALGIIALIVGLLSLILTPFLKSKKNFRRFLAGYGKCILMTILVILNIYGFLYLLPFRSSTIVSNGNATKKYTEEDLIKVNNYLVEQANELSKKVARDKDGNILLTTDCEKDLHQSMKKLSGQYPRLSGFYGPVKSLKSSALLDWMNIGGVTFPFTKEAVRNSYINDLYFPTLASHELCHNKGYYKENEAEFLSFLACTSSDNDYIKYSGYIYASCDVMMELDKNGDLGNAECLNEQVHLDLAYAQCIAEERYENEVNDTLEDIVSEPAEQVSEVGWDTQAKILKENNYDGVIRLLLEYYDGILY
jgi:hypothetical protein